MRSFSKQFLLTCLLVPVISLIISEQVEAQSPNSRFQPLNFDPTNHSARSSKPGQSFAANIVLVTYKTQGTDLKTSQAEVHQSINAQKVERLSPLAGNAEKIFLDSTMSVEQAITILSKNPNVQYAEPDYLLTKSQTSNDPYYLNGFMWGMYGDTLTPTNVNGSQANEAWAAGTTGSGNVYVGIIDEGVDNLHEDLAANTWNNPFDTLDGTDNDGNGYIDDIYGWDFLHADNTIYDAPDGDIHGTHIAGIIGAIGGNGLGVVGVNWNVRIITTKFLGPSGGYTSSVIRALDYYIDLKQRHGINIVATNNSWGGAGFSQTMLDAIDRAGDAGILFIAAAGNGGSDGIGDNNDLTPNYPSNFECTKSGTRGWDCVLAVAAINSSGTRISSSNYGPTSVDLSTPGAGIFSTIPRNTSFPNGGYNSYSGTSMATPFVVGAAALCASMGASAQQVRNAIVSSTTPTSSLAEVTVTGGRLDIGTMITKCQAQTTPTPPSCPLRSSGDIDCSATINISDLSTILSNFGVAIPDTPGDLNNDNVVNIQDLGILLANFGKSL